MREGKIKSALNTILDVVEEFKGSGQVLASQEMAKKRLKVCQICPEFTGSQCKVCGCFMHLKTELQAAKCPMGYWEEKIMEEAMFGEMSAEFTPSNCCKG